MDNQKGYERRDNKRRPIDFNNGNAAGHWNVNRARHDKWGN